MEELQLLTKEQLVQKYLVLHGLYLAKDQYVSRLENTVEALWERIEYLQSQIQILHSDLSDLNKTKEQLASALEQNP